ncbi:MAG: hypothetical protein OK438_00765 [Thaumarchaeota archaeon]|nr:hypothetical protein [Nitrososphaerota archaeon]
MNSPKGEGGEEERSYDVHGAVAMRLVGHDPVSEIIDRTLSFFRSPTKTPDLTLVLGQYPSQEWTPTGTLVGDRILYDPESRTTSVLRNKATKKVVRSEAEYVVIGDLRAWGEPVTVYVPSLRRPMTPRKTFGRDVRHGHLRRAMLAVAGNPLGMRQVVRQAEMITEAILEPFLFYRLPAKGLSLIHAASVCSQSAATVFAGSANIGKSTLALRFAKEKAAFLGDALVILAESGEVLPYPGLVKLHGGHLASFPELRIRLTAGMGPIGTYLLRSELSANPMEALESLPQREMVELFDEVIIPKRCKLKEVVLIRRGPFAEAKVEEIDPELLARVLSAEIYWEAEAAPWRNGQFIYAPSAATGRDFFQEAAEHHAKVDEIMRRGVANAKCFMVALPIEAPVQMVEGLVPGFRGSTQD